MRYVIYDKWTVERVERSALIAIGDFLKSENNLIEYFLPSCFSTCLPSTPFDQIDGIFTWGANNLFVQEFYRKEHPRVPIYTVDSGFLRRDLGYKYILKDGKFPAIGSPGDRFKALGLKSLKNSMWNETGHVLVVMQNHHKEWYDQTIRQLKSIVKDTREIRLRPYPEDINTKAEYGKTLKDDLKGCFAVVTYNSTCLYEAIQKGIPVFCSIDCPASIFCETNLYKILKATQLGDEKDQFLNDVAYSQYTLDELRKGEFISIL